MNRASELKEKPPTLLPIVPLGIFLSYAREDSDIVNAFYNAFERLRGAVYGNLKIFYDKKAIVPGDIFREDIQSHLRDSQYLIVFYTGTYKKSHSYTGFEVGYFDALIDDERRVSGTSDRRIVSFYTEDPPPTTSDIEGISLKISRDDLELPADAFLRKILGDPDSLAWEFARFLRNLAQLAESGLGTLIQRSRDQVEEDARKRNALIESEIVPVLIRSMLDCLGARVARRSIEQKLIEFEISRPENESILTEVPRDTILRGHGDVYMMLGISAKSDDLNWGAFQKALMQSSKDRYPQIIRSISRVFLSALTGAEEVDNSQIIQSPYDKKIYRIIVTRHFEYYNGKVILHMYFIEYLTHADYGDERTSFVLQMVNTTCRYRFAFFEPESAFSEYSFELASEEAALSEKIHLLLRELTLIEEQAVLTKLNSVKAILAVFGHGFDVSQLNSMSERWKTARSKMVAAAEAYTAADKSTAEKFAAARVAWLKSLREFNLVAREVNERWSKKAVDALKSYIDQPIPAINSDFESGEKRIPELEPLHDGGECQTDEARRPLTGQSAGTVQNLKSIPRARLT